MVDLVLHKRPAEVMTLQDDQVFQPFGFYEFGRILMDGGRKRPANTLQVGVDGLSVLSQQTIALDTGSRHLASSKFPVGRPPTAQSVREISPSLTLNSCKLPWAPL